MEIQVLIVIFSDFRPRKENHGKNISHAPAQTTGINVFPGEVEDHIASMEAVDVVDVVGMKHYLFDEGIFAFVRPKQGQTLTSDAILYPLQNHCLL